MIQLLIIRLALIPALQFAQPVFEEKCVGEVKNNIKQGYWKCYYADGLLQQEGNYKDGRKVGIWKLYHANGILAGEGPYINDEEKGKWKFYDDEGTLIMEQDY